MISLLQFTLEDDVYFVHFFVMSAHSVLYHGKAIKANEFRTKFPHQLPNPKLCLWHYAQCAQAHIRGFSVEAPRYSGMEHSQNGLVSC